MNAYFLKNRYSYNYQSSNRFFNVFLYLICTISILDLAGFITGVWTNQSKMGNNYIDIKLKVNTDE